MTPLSPAIDGLPVTTYAEDQPQYNQLPCYRDSDGCLTIRWGLTWKERLKVLLRGQFFLQVLTFGYPLQPLKPTVDQPSVKGGHQ